MRLLEDGFDVGDGDGAFAEDFPIFVLDADDRGGETGTGFAGVEDEREAQAELLHDLIAAGAGREAGDVGAGAGDGAAKFVDELFDDGMFGPAERDFAGVGGDFERDAVCGFDNEGKAAGPEGLGELGEIAGRVLHRGALEEALAHQDERLFERVDEDGEGARFGAALDTIKLVDGGEIEGVGGEAVESVGRDGDDTAANEEMSRVSQCIDFRCLRVNAQQFCRQCFGPRRSRMKQLQRSAALPLLGRRYHGWNGGSNGEGAQCVAKTRGTADPSLRSG